MGLLRELIEELEAERDKAIKERDEAIERRDKAFRSVERMRSSFDKVRCSNSLKEITNLRKHNGQLQRERSEARYWARKMMADRDRLNHCYKLLDEERDEAIKERDALKNELECSKYYDMEYQRDENRYWERKMMVGRDEWKKAYTELQMFITRYDYDKGCRLELSMKADELSPDGGKIAWG